MDAWRGLVRTAFAAFQRSLSRNGSALRFDLRIACLFGRSPGHSARFVAAGLDFLAGRGLGGLRGPGNALAARRRRRRRRSVESAGRLFRIRRRDEPGRPEPRRRRTYGWRSGIGAQGGLDIVGRPGAGAGVCRAACRLAALRIVSAPAGRSRGRSACLRRRSDARCDDASLSRRPPGGAIRKRERLRRGDGAGRRAGAGPGRGRTFGARLGDGSGAGGAVSVRFGADSIARRRIVGGRGLGRRRGPGLRSVAQRSWQAQGAAPRMDRRRRFGRAGAGRFGLAGAFPVGSAVARAHDFEFDRARPRALSRSRLADVARRSLARARNGGLRIGFSAISLRNDRRGEGSAQLAGAGSLRERPDRPGDFAGLDRGGRRKDASEIPPGLCRRAGGAAWRRRSPLAWPAGLQFRRSRRLYRFLRSAGNRRGYGTGSNRPKRDAWMARMERAWLGRGDALAGLAARRPDANRGKQSAGGLRTSP
ncbi:MAG: hypothetical protein BWZ10_01948 [candidate division BRC1 bacterium ADurb.BinA364]|nr:MAG: hypothetical protein BWZ10_01948 [candidate division BRC1 bacterium ADurb.BinA364]